jgi:hypothetical protein
MAANIAGTSLSSEEIQAVKNAVMSKLRTSKSVQFKNIRAVGDHRDALVCGEVYSDTSLGPIFFSAAILFRNQTSDQPVIANIKTTDDVSLSEISNCERFGAPVL